MYRYVLNLYHSRKYVLEYGQEYTVLFLWVVGLEAYVVSGRPGYEASKMLFIM